MWLSTGNSAIGPTSISYGAGGGSLALVSGNTYVAWYVSYDTGGDVARFGTVEFSVP